MPFAAPTNFDEEQKRKQQQGGVNVSGTSTSFASNVPGQEQPSGQSGQQKSSGQYSNIQSYLDANKTQADGMGQRIAGDISNKAEDASKKIQSFESSAPKVQAYDPNAAIQKATALSDDERLQYQQTKKTGGYTGPDSLEKAQGYQETMQAGQTAIQNVKDAGSETGQQQLLKQTYARPKYTAGENRLDQVLLQNSAGSRAGLENVRNKYSGLENMLSGATTKVGGAINDAKTQALSNKQSILSAEQAARKAIVDPLELRAKEANDKNPALIDRIINDASDETLSEETLAMLGLTEGEDIFSLDLKNYVNPDRTQVGIDNVATAEERQKYAALAQLFEDPTMNQISSDGKSIAPVKFNKEQFAKDKTAKQAEYQNAYKTAAGSVYIMGNGGTEKWAIPQTPEQIESQIIPDLQAKIDRAPTAPVADEFRRDMKAYQEALDRWKSEFSPNRKIKKG